MADEKYVIHGPKTLWSFETTTAGRQLYNALLRHIHLPEAMIDVHTHQKVSYKTLFEKTCRLAQSLQRYGCNINDTISVCSENNLSFFYPVIAAFYLGVITAPLNENYTKGELENALSISKPKIIFCSKAALSKIIEVRRKFPFIEKIIVLDSEEDVHQYESLSNFILRNSDGDYINFEPVDFDPAEQVAAVLCSSGTTGLPKGVMLTHRNIVVRFAHARDPTLGTQTIPGTTVLQPMPFFHGFGFCITLGYLLVGLRVIAMKKFEPELFLKTIQDYEVRSVGVVPPVVVFLAKSPLVDKYDLSSLKEVGVGAAPLGKEIGEMVVKRLNVSLRQGYGLTEAVMAVMFTPENDYRIGSSGKMLPLMSAKVVDIETGKCLGPNLVGEICLKGDMVMKGYAGNMKATREAIDGDGWLHTGDLGYYSEDQHFYIVNRLKELIKYKGFQVPPAELEALLLEHPSIKDAGVIGIPDENAGELPAAFIVKQPGKQITEKEVFDYIAGLVSSAKHLRGGVRFIDEIPKNATGKIMRNVLAELAVKIKSKL